MNVRALLGGVLFLASLPGAAGVSAAQVHERDPAATGGATAMRQLGELGRAAFPSSNLVPGGGERFVSRDEVFLFLEREQDGSRPWRAAFGKYSIRGTGTDTRLPGTSPSALDDLRCHSPADDRRFAAEHDTGEIFLACRREKLP